MKRIDTMVLADRLSGLGDVPSPTTITEGNEEVPPALIAAVEEALLQGETHYTVRLGLPELRRELGRKVLQMGGPSHETSLDNILVTTGESEALFVALLGMALSPGEVLVASSRPRHHEGLFRLMGLEARYSDESRKPTSETRLVYREWSSGDEAQDALAGLAEEQDLPDILNLESALAREPRAEPDRSERMRARAFPPFSAARTIVLGNLDALPGMSSFRVGFVLGPERWLRRIRVWKQALTICSPAPSQRAAWIALGEAKSGESKS